jgi:hypothetical protein
VCRKQQGCPWIFWVWERHEEKRGSDHCYGVKSTECCHYSLSLFSLEGLHIVWDQKQSRVLCNIDIPEWHLGLLHIEHNMVGDTHYSLPFNLSHIYGMQVTSRLQLCKTNHRQNSLYTHCSSMSSLLYDSPFTYLQLLQYKSWIRQPQYCNKEHNL